MLSLIASTVAIALTIDDYPMTKGVFVSPEKQTEIFIDACEKSSCKAAFFCIGENCTQEGHALLAKLNANGHFLCNHSMNHLHLSSQTLEDFEQEVKQVDAILTPYQNMRKWYRYPYLDYGNRVSAGGSQDKTLKSLEILQRLGYTEGFVTINTFDWHINARMIEAFKKGQSIDFSALKVLYLQLVKSWCEYYISFYQKALPENITHTLLLHANDLNTLFLQDIIEMIQASGWSVVSPERAFADVSWRQKVLSSSISLDNKPSTLNTPAIDKLLEENKVFTDKVYSLPKN